MCMQLVRSAEEHDNIGASIRLQLKTFWNPTTPTENKDTEFLIPEKYLPYCVSLSVYKEAKVRALEELEVIKKHMLKMFWENMTKRKDEFGSRKIMVGYACFLFSKDGHLLMDWLPLRVIRILNDMEWQAFLRIVSSMTPTHLKGIVHRLS